MRRLVDGVAHGAPQRAHQHLRVPFLGVHSQKVHVRHAIVTQLLSQVVQPAQRTLHQFVFRCVQLLIFVAARCFCRACPVDVQIVVSRVLSIVQTARVLNLWNKSCMCQRAVKMKHCKFVTHVHNCTHTHTHTHAIRTDSHV